MSARRASRRAVAEVHLRGIAAAAALVAIGALIALTHAHGLVLAGIPIIVLGPVMGPPLPYTLGGDTSVRAARIDEIDAAPLPGSPTAGSVADKLAQILLRVPAGGFATQYGSISCAAVNPNTATIAAVDLTRSVVIFLGATEGNGPTNVNLLPYLALTNSTTVTATSPAGVAAAVTVNFVVLSFAQPVSSIQSGTIVFAGTVASATATISAVTTSKACLFFLGMGVGASNDVRDYSTLALTNATTITAAHAGSSSIQTTTVPWMIVNF